jgi:CHAT domain-containing protein
VLRALDRNLGSFAVLGRNAATSEAWREQIKITGQQLYGLFIKHPEISEALRVGRDIAGDSRLTLRFMGPRDFVGLPFELMYDEDRALALDHPLSRMVTGQICRRDPLGPAVFARARAGDGACTALVISANVSGQMVFKGQRYGFPPVPDVEQEGLKVKETLEEYGWKVTLLSGADVTIASITKALDGCPHHLVHYSGHGFYTPLDPDRSGLVLRDAGGDAAVLEALRLRQLLKTAQTRFVFLSCCSGAASGDSAQLIGSDYLGVIDAIIAAGVPAALGYRWPVDAAGARMLAETFYDKLQQRETLEAALLFARQEIRAQMNDATWAAPILVVQE